jgi:hypothetical protein
VAATEVISNNGLPTYFQSALLSLLKLISKFNDGKHDTEFYSVQLAKYALLLT